MSNAKNDSTASSGELEIDAYAQPLNAFQSCCAILMRMHVSRNIKIKTGNTARDKSTALYKTVTMFLSSII